MLIKNLLINGELKSLVFILTFSLSGVANAMLPEKETISLEQRLADLVDRAKRNEEEERTIKLLDRSLEVQKNIMATEFGEKKSSLCTELGKILVEIGVTYKIDIDKKASVKQVRILERAMDRKWSVHEEPKQEEEKEPIKKNRNHSTRLLRWSILGAGVTSLALYFYSYVKKMNRSAHDS